MDFAKFTTDELLAVFPASEDDYWELKSAIYLTPPKRGDLKKELGKQVSAFANTGGGALVFGVSDSRELEECELVVGRQSMKDYLATMVEQSVEYPIRHFKIHQIPFSTDSKKSVFVIEVQDSPAAPHQAKDERCYYYRIDGHSKPAPHFHVELLRARMTKSVLEVENIEYTFEPPIIGSQPHLRLVLKVQLRNTSMQAATSWGIHVKMPWENYRWIASDTCEFLHDGACVHGILPLLLPNQRSTINVRVSGSAVGRYPMRMEFEKMIGEFVVLITPVSQNFVGEASPLDWRDYSTRCKVINDLERVCPS